MSRVVRQIGTMVFSDEDQQRFAVMSGDRNPMHMDPIVARRLITGRQVVHGIHVLVTALEFWCREQPDPLVSISCVFSNPVSVGDRVIFSQLDEAGQPTVLEAVVDGLPCARVTLTLAPESPVAGSGGIQAHVVGADERSLLERSAHPLDEEPRYHEGKRYALLLDHSDLSVHFPNVNRYLGQEVLASVLALSYVVGMVCPGLHSVFSSADFSLSNAAAADGSLRFAVRKYDPRFGLFDIRVDGPIQGAVKAFLRPPAQSQPSVQELVQHVRPQEFSGTKSLVIGGSRGLGELTAKILAAGAGASIITYAHGFKDACAVRDAINGFAPAHCQALHMDFYVDRFDSALIDWNSLDTVYFFATPRIFRKKADVFDTRLFQEFCDFYVAKFYELCSFLETTLTQRQMTVCLPSTVFVEERPKGMAEYAMAKAAAEVMAQEINRSFKRVAVLCTRLPRLSTDQTTSIVKLATGSNVQTLLPLVRSMQRPRAL